MNTKICYVILCVIMLVQLFYILLNGICVLKICQLLKVFNDATNTLSGIYYPTVNLFMVEALNIVGVLYDCISQDEDF